MRFSFQAKNITGEVRDGIIEAADKETAISMIQDKGLVLLAIKKEKMGSGIISEIEHLWEGVNLYELSVFFRQIATLIEAKVSLTVSLKTVNDQTDNAYLKTVIKAMTNDIEDGVSFSEAMGKHPEVFKPLAVSMVRAGELSGNLQRSIMYLADNSEKNYELNAKIKGAFFYPAFVSIAAVVVSFIVFTTVLPKLTNIFKDLNVVIPWYTKAFMNIGDFMQSYWWVVAAILLAGMGGFFYYIKTEDGKKEWDVIKMEIPLIGKIFRCIYITRFAENFSVLLSGGIPIVKALLIVSEVVNSTAYESVILRAVDEVKIGGAMSNVFARSDQFPPIVSQMIKIGEESGQISEVLHHVAKFYGKETDRMTRNMATLMEPILICFIGAGVAIIVFAVLVPIYNIAGAI